MASAAITQQAFDGLLAWLDADRAAAAERYERIRLKLIKFFEWRGSPFPEDHADRTLDRVAATLVAGTTIRTDTPERYCYGVARMILLEARWNRYRAGAAGSAGSRVRR